MKIKTYLKPPPSGVMGPLSMGNWGYNSYKWSYFTRFITIVTGRTLYDFAEISFGTPFAHTWMSQEVGKWLVNGL